MEKMEKEVEYKLIRFYRKVKEIDMMKSKENENEYNLQEPILVEGMSVDIMNDKDNYLTFRITRYENETDIYKYSWYTKTSNIIKIFKIKIKDERTIEAIETFKNIGGLGFLEKFSELLLVSGIYGITLRYSILVNSFRLNDTDTISEINVDTNFYSSIENKKNKNKKISENYKQKNIWIRIQNNYNDEIYASQKLQESFDKFEELILITNTIKNRTKIWYKILLSDLCYYVLTRMDKIISKNWRIAKEL